MSSSEDRRECVEIDLSRISSADELQAALADALKFPDFYGRNWNAFWDSICGLVEMPQRLILRGWTLFAARLPEEARMMSECLEDMAREYPEIAPETQYS